MSNARIDARRPTARRSFAGGLDRPLTPASVPLRLCRWDMIWAGAALGAALALATPPMGYPAPPIDSSPVTGLTPREAAKRALGPAAAAYVDSVFVEFPVSGDLPPPDAKPSYWSVQFFDTPQLLAPGICMARELGVGIKLVDKSTGDGPRSVSAEGPYPAYVFRVVGTLPNPGKMRGTPRPVASEACDRLRPIGRYMLNRDLRFPGAVGAFAAGSPEVALRGALLFDRIAGRRPAPGVKAGCSRQDDDFCRDAGKILSELSFDSVVYIAAKPCPAVAAARACVEVEALYDKDHLDKGRCWLAITPEPGARAGPADVLVTCRVPPRMPPGYWPIPEIVSDSEEPAPRL